MIMKIYATSPLYDTRTSIPGLLALPGVLWSSPNEPIQIVDKYAYLGSCIDFTKDDILMRIGKAKTAFVNVHHLLRSLPLKGRVYNGAVRSI
ncbi:hypothetical protein T265_08752 [Opisthorchis viverrini]|uniref:Uncharacterized protein n=1 Tax=Opisthorchis viverrini TaxID=6198 RepID=A0A074ZJ17_OPIVI|nr:hypothetical protein T265_08752 [Opisthorchis viverrini]KER23340.1 hypothetical protein T265_08752 [Opisthorchis viverrini]